MEIHEPLFNHHPQLISSMFLDNTCMMNIEGFDGSVMPAGFPQNIDDAPYVQGGFFDDELGFFVDAGSALLGVCLENDDILNSNYQMCPLVQSNDQDRLVDDDDSCGTSNGTRANKRQKRDRSKTLVSERKRRGSMKEKLYELRSLVPNITKMDKASIIADAVNYVLGLQKQANKLEEELAMLEESSSKIEQKEKNFRHDNCTKLSSEVIHKQEGKNAVSGKIIRVAAHELGGGNFHVKVECCKNGDHRAASSLYNAIESLECFHLESSNFCTLSDKFVLTITLKIQDLGEEMMNATTAKLWAIGGLLKEGFDIDVAAIL